MAVAIRIKRGTKANIESAKATLKQWEQVYATDTDEIGIYDGTNIRWQSSGGGEVDLNEMAYFDYAGRIYGAKYNLLANAWEHSLTVDPLEISENSSSSSPRGTAQYPNGETEGVIIPQGVTSIGEYAFYNWEANNQPLVIPNSVTSIGAHAFGYWTSNNQPLVIPNGVKSIGSYAFRVWQKNKHPLVIPESVESIGINAFSFWVLVPYIEIQAITPPTLANINAFSNQNNAPIYVPNESVDDYKTANKWVSLADRIFPISDKGEIDLNEMSYFDYAGSIYGDKYSLLASAWERSLAVDPSGISEDSDMSSPRGTAQYPNGETEGVIIPHSVTSIGNSAFFAWSSNNQPLVIPNSVTSIENSAFYNWTSNNQQLVIPNSVTSIGWGAFNGWTANNQPLVIPNSMTSIGDYAFCYWTSNNQPLVIPNSVTSIGQSAFESWSSNNQPLVIPNSVTSIGQSAFESWSSNNQPLVIPDSVTSIGEYAFYNWVSAKEFIMESETPPTITIYSFSNTNNAPIYVPDESVDDYKEATNWVDLADRIFPISDKGNTYTKGEIDLMIGDIESALDAILGV